MVSMITEVPVPKIGDLVVRSWDYCMFLNPKKYQDIEGMSEKIIPVGVVIDLRDDFDLRSEKKMIKWVHVVWQNNLPKLFPWSEPKLRDRYRSRTLKVVSS